MKTKIKITGEEQRRYAIELMRGIPLVPVHCIEIKPLSRSLEQNSKMWAMLAEISSQLNWHGQKLTPEEWKCVFTASLKQQKVCPGIDGGFVVIGAYTSKMTIAEMGELIELAQAFGAQHGVVFRDIEYKE